MRNPLAIDSPLSPNPFTRLHVRLVSADVDQDSALRTSLRRGNTLDVAAHMALADTAQREIAADVVVVDAGPPAPDAATLERVRARHSSALMIVVAPEIDSEAQALGASVGAVGYLKKGAAVADIAALVVEFAAIGKR